MRDQVAGIFFLVTCGPEEVDGIVIGNSPNPISSCRTSLTWVAYEILSQ
jgi:hypothetical protein